MLALLAVAVSGANMAAAAWLWNRLNPAETYPFPPTEPGEPALCPPPPPPPGR
jgi:hypothetical protein